MLSATIVLPILLTITILITFIGIIYISRIGVSVEGYIVSRNSIGIRSAIATVVASVVGAWILFSPAEAGTWAGITGLIGYSVGQASPFIAFAFIGPRIRRLMKNGHSLTEYVWYRFGRAMYIFIMGVMLFYMFVFLSAELTAIARAVSILADIPLVWTAIIVAIGTIAYTSYGGIRASMFTDNIQFAIGVPLLISVFIATIVILGGFHSAFDPVTTISPQLLSFDHVPGIEFAVTLFIAIFAANMFHQGFWQRVYACRDDKVLFRAFILAGIITIPIVFIAGLLGVMSVGAGVPTDMASVAFFFLVIKAFPSWLALVILILALILVMSSMDTVINGIASAVTTDMHRFLPRMDALLLLRSSRVLTILVTIPAIFIAAQGYSVLYLFLIADLVCAGSVFPVLYGLYDRRLKGKTALLSSIFGISSGAIFFPKNDFTPWLVFPQELSFIKGGEGDFLFSFAIALGVSIGTSLVCSLVSFIWKPEAVYDHAILNQQICSIEHEEIK
jgi:Na+/proline symporter